jgi:hypothetical protein
LENDFLNSSLASSRGLKEEEGMPDPNVVNARRELIERHQRLTVLVDRLSTIWDVCLFDAEDGRHEPIEGEWQKELVGDLEWMQEFLADAIANDGDLRRHLAAAPPQTPPPGSPPDLKVVRET